MPDFNAKMHQNRFRHNAGGAYSAPADPIAGFKGGLCELPDLRFKGTYMLLLRGGEKKGGEGGARPVCLLILTILAAGLGWEVGRGRGRGREGSEGWVGAPLCEILYTPLDRWN